MERGAEPTSRREVLRVWRECAYGEGELGSYKGNFASLRGASGVAAEVLAGRDPLGYCHPW